MKAIIILIALFIVAGVIFSRLRRDSSSSSGRPPPPNWMPADVRGLKLVPGPKACSAAASRANETLPPDEAPKLPLPGCSRKKCECRYVPVAGRREEQRRAGEDRRDQIRFGPDSGDRRSGGDRRKSGADPWGVDRK